MDVVLVNGIFSGLIVGCYDVFVCFGESCVLQLDEVVVIDQLEELEVEVLMLEVSCGGNSDGEVLLVIEGGNVNYEYRLNNSIMIQILNFFDNLLVGDYVVFVEDEKGCQDLIQFVVENVVVLLLWIDFILICFGDSFGIVIIEFGKFFEGFFFIFWIVLIGFGGIC